MRKDEEFYTSLRHAIGKYMIESPDLAALRLVSLVQVLPVEIRLMLRNAAVTVNLISDAGLIFPVLMVAHQARSPFKEAANLSLLEDLVKTTYEHMGIAHAIARDDNGYIRAGYSPITKRFTLEAC